FSTASVRMSEPVRMAIVGAGHWGPNLIRNFHSSTASVVKMVVDRDGGRLEQQARHRGRRADGARRQAGPDPVGRSRLYLQSDGAAGPELHRLGEVRSRLLRLDGPDQPGTDPPRRQRRLGSDVA